MSAPHHSVLETKVGPIRGTSDTSCHYFGGVPYGHAERFEEVQPLTWVEPLDATSPGPAPPQRIAGLDLVPGMVPATTDERCHTLEIWTPNPDASLPVLVWVPGGSFLVGGASLPTYRGDRLAADGDVVVVGVNYRLGALGFLAADGVPSNLGLRDLGAALRWIDSNIAAFGGDSSHITVMGESAGAGALAHLLAGSARPSQPVKAAILQSGSPAMTLTAATAAEIATALGPIDHLRAMPIDALLDAQEAARRQLLGRVGMMPFHPWLDDDIVPMKPLDAIRADYFGAETLVAGTTADEMSLFRAQVPELPGETAHKLLGRKAKGLGLDPMRAADALAAAGGDLLEAIADVDLHLPALLMAEAHAANGHRAFRYRFTWGSPPLGACHAMDLPFTFATLDVDDWRQFASADGPRAIAADHLSTVMRTAWTSTAHSDTPANWPPHRSDEVMLLGLDSRPGPDPLSKRLAAWRPHP